MRRNAGQLVFLACMWLGACGADDPAPPGAPVSGIDTPTGDDRDSGADGDDDAGSAQPRPDASVSKSVCARVSALQGASEDYPSATTTESPSDFSVRMQAETWLVEDCTQPKLMLTFADGACPNGNGHALQITLDLNDVADGVIHSGPNTIAADRETTTGISIRYTRPKALKPTGTWGTCAGATGQLVFLNPPSASAAETLEARYDLSLTACDGSTASAQLVVGSFKLPLRYGLRRYCPDRSE